MTQARKPIPEGFHTVTPQLTLDNAATTIEFYKRAFGAQEVSRSVGPDGRVMHAELRIGDSPLMVNDAVMGTKGPHAIGGTPASLWLYVKDCDALFNQAVEAGAEIRNSLTDMFWGDRMGVVMDPEGYTWTIATRKEDLTREELDTRAQEFFKQFAQQG